MLVFVAAPKTWRQQLIIPTLTAPRGVPSFRAAGALHELDGIEPGFLDVSVLSSRHLRAPGYVIHRVAALDGCRRHHSGRRPVHERRPHVVRPRCGRVARQGRASAGRRATPRRERAVDPRDVGSRRSPWAERNSDLAAHPRPSRPCRRVARQLVRTADRAFARELDAPLRQFDSTGCARPEAPELRSSTSRGPRLGLRSSLRVQAHTPAIGTGVETMRVTSGSPPRAGRCCTRSGVTGIILSASVGPSRRCISAGNEGEAQMGPLRCATDERHRASPHHAASCDWRRCRGQGRGRHAGRGARQPRSRASRASVRGSSTTTATFAASSTSSWPTTTCVSCRVSRRRCPTARPCRSSPPSRAADRRRLSRQAEHFEQLRPGRPERRARAAGSPCRSTRRARARRCRNR